MEQLTLEQQRAVALAKARQRAAGAQGPAAEAPQTGVVEQAGSGVNEGIAAALGLPVDIVTNLLNYGAKAMGQQPIEKPFGGSESIRGALGPLISEAQPQTMPQRFARRVGQDVGAGAVMGPAMGVSSVGAAALNTAADVGSGLGASVAQEVAPGSQIAEMAGSLAGGLGTVGAARSMRPGPMAPTRDDLMATKNAAYAKVDADPTRLTTVEADELKRRIVDAVSGAKIHASRHPKATSMVDDLLRMPEPTLSELDQWRQVVSRDVAGATDDSERRLGQIIKDTIDGYVDDIRPGTFTDETVDALRTGRQTTQRIKKSDMVETAIEKGERRAASTGTGGNTINAIRQNIRSILDDPRKARGFTLEEREIMEGIVRGTPGVNAARLGSRFAPTSGAFPLAGAFAQGGAWGATGNPLFMAPAAIGAISKVIGEKLTGAQVGRLSEFIRNGGQVGAKGFTDAERAVLQAVTAVSAANATGAAPQ